MSTLASRMAGWPRYTTAAVALFVFASVSSWAPLLATKTGNKTLLSISVLGGLFGQLAIPAFIVAAVFGIVKKEKPRWLPFTLVAFFALQFVLGMLGLFNMVRGHGDSW